MGSQPAPPCEDLTAQVTLRAASLQAAALPEEFGFLSEQQAAAQYKDQECL